MAKPTYAKLKLSVNTEVKTLEWEDQIIEVKQYLPIQEKLAFISRVINSSSDENRFYNKGKIDVFFVLNIIDNYTNITFTEKQREESIKLYDSIKSSGFYDAVIAIIPEDELTYLYDLITETIKQIYNYQNSIYGILDTINTDYSELDLDIQRLSEKLSGNKDDIKLLNEVLTKMG